MGSPPATGTTPAAELTPGQAACIAWNRAFGEEHGITARDEWGNSDAAARAAWEAAAKAVSDCFPLATQAVRERDEARAERDRCQSALKRLADYAPTVIPTGRELRQTIRAMTSIARQALADRAGLEES